MRGVLLVLLLLLAPLVAATPSAGRVAEASYTGGWPPAWGSSVQAIPDCGSEQNLGGACFAFTPEERWATVTLRDDLTATVCGVASLTYGTHAYHAYFCDQGVVDLAKVPGASTLRVTLSLSEDLPTTGTISVLFVPDA